MSHTNFANCSPGIYQHYKGNRYRVFGMAQHSETDEWLVLYQALYGARGFWARPAKMFCEEVLIDGKSLPRFKQLETEATRTLQAIAEPL